MNSFRTHTKISSWLGLFLFLIGHMLSSSLWGQDEDETSTRVLFETGFEISEGYESNANLNGVNGWQTTFDGGSGIPEDEFFEGKGQQAFVGFSPFDGLSDENFSLFLWQPINYSPPQNRQSVISFQVLFQIFDNTDDTKARDDFRWSFFNQDNQRLFTLDFDNNALRLNYLLGSSNEFFETRTTFNNNTIYNLEVQMDFEANSWSAWLNDDLVIENQPAFEDGMQKNLGDVSAMWVVNTPSDPGDNFMIFDDYKIVEIFSEPPPIVNGEVRISKNDQDVFVLQARAESNSDWTIQGSTNLEDWTPLLQVSLTPDWQEWELDTSDSHGFWRILQNR